MIDQDINQSKYNELRNICKYHIDSYNALYQIKSENDEELNTIYNMIKTEMIDSQKHPPLDIIKDILSIIPYNNRYAKSYLYLAKLIFDNCHVKDIDIVEDILDSMFDNGGLIRLNKYKVFEEIKSKIIDNHANKTIFRAIMYNDLESFIFFTERDGFDKDQTRGYNYNLYPYDNKGYSFLELCCYH
ncbi:hypothetical protein TVAG_011120 [Trichomonas vaginalis G3]|uniref:DUF3447 domain-containing protein n=1 Tax=Trichomonas vaginalis (strain ATCC PRA-98 / G3) TaxID=412133 RepID=A2DP38_TRIV3|nr:protein ubiquitination [Trichomonas vaginalis G3]EAY17887.1 hypothetical protein TVAG_011120 [Trichomonas vaginalis G3]KAI5489895.1 protein ubiquitination [Trichomonas vaginalis G3]|eukprot:XP_001330022.1 hypothetical protein [Trichomonas vaginalis G3]